MSLQPGASLGLYEILAPLGVGGMGEVYRARDTKLGREVAIKLLLEEVSTDPDRMARFEREARVLASLNHPNIATLYGFESEGDTSFLVMELVEGDTLADRIARGPVPVDEATAMFLQIAEGLEAAHENGIVHRDLKPANIKVRRAEASGSQTVKILDFGLAKAMAPDPISGEASELSESPTMTLAATMRGEVLGTAGYMSPEQARGGAVDKRSDVWAFGVCLFEALTGRHTFDGPTISDKLASILKEDPDWSALPAGLPRRLEELLRRCLEKRPGDRLRDIGEARIALTKVLAEPEPEVGEISEGQAVAPVARGASLRLALAGLLAGSVLSGGLVWFLKPDPPRYIVRSVLSADPSEPVAIDAFGRDLVLTSDGRTVIYSTEKGLYVRPVDRLGGTLLDDTVGASNPMLSPDERWVAYSEASTNRLSKVPLEGGAPVTVCAFAGLFTGGFWAKDDSILFTTFEDGLYRVPSTGGEAELILSPDPEAGGIYVTPRPLPRPDSILLSYTLGGSLEQADTLVVSLESGETKKLFSGGGSATYLSTGHLVFAAAGTLRAVAFDAERREILGSPMQVMTDVLTKSIGGDYSVAADGTLAYVSGQGGSVGTPVRLVWVDRDGSEEDLPTPVRAYEYFRISPDGRQLALSSRDEEADLWVWDFARETHTRLTFTASVEIYAVWTPDGREVMFSSDRAGIISIFKKAADGTGQIEMVAGGHASAIFPTSLSPDGRHLIYREGVRASSLFVKDLLSDDEAELLIGSEFGELNAEVSPDGRWVAYQSNASGRTEIYVRPFPEVESGRWQVSTEGGRMPAWSRDGRELFYDQELGSTVRMMAVAVGGGESFRQGPPEELFSGSYHTLVGRSYDIEPDGERFLMMKIASTAEGGEPKVILVQNWLEELKRLVPTG